MSDETIRLVLTPPTPDSPGFLRRQYQALKLQRSANTGDPEAIREIIELLLPYVTSPTDPEAAEAALWEASEAQIKTALRALLGNRPSQMEPNGDSSDAG